MEKRKRVHNKSGLTGLAFLRHSDEVLSSLWEKYFLEDVGQEKMPVQSWRKGEDVGSRKTFCYVRPNKKGKVCMDGSDICYDYQLAAFIKFGRTVLEGVEPNKDAESLTISHLCGTRNCFNPEHLELVPKRINDERTHCHFCLKSAMEKYGFHTAIQWFHHGGFCPHGEPFGLCYDHDVFMD